MEKERKYQHAFVKYTKAGKIVSGSLIIARNYPKDNGVWLEVTESICCEPDCECTGNGIKRAYIRFSQGHVVPGSLLISDMCPPDIGCWKEIPVDICCKEKNCTTSTTSSTTTTTTIQPVTTSTTSTTSTSTSTTTTLQPITSSTTTTSSTSTTTSSTTSTSTSTSTSTTSTSSTSSTTSSTTSTTTTEQPTTSTSTTSTSTSSTTSTTSTSSTTTSTTVEPSTTTTSTTTVATETNIFEIVVEPTIDRLDFDLYAYSGNVVSGTIDWGDGNTDTFGGFTSVYILHNYSTPGIYTVTFTYINQVGDNIYADFVSELSATQSKITSITSILNPTISQIFVTGKGTMNLDFQNSVNFGLTISGISNLLPLNITNILDLSGASNLYIVVFNYATAAGLLLPASLPNNTLLINVYDVSNTFMNDMLIAADNSGLLNQTFDSTFSGTASGAGLIAYNNLITKGWTVTINP